MGGAHLFGGAGFGLGHLLWWAMLFAAVILLGRWLVRSAASADGADPGRALSILKERYARGEIDLARLEERKRNIA